ncbi:MAG: hypothetical protein O3A95_02050 [Planctomycetota bacterium]|nr:hypothetical protein [Planctomycetota bacterium]MDA1113066.1 hypothetical protein [Planctomycetota bacterium]
MKFPLPTILVPTTLLGLLAWAISDSADTQLEAAPMFIPVMVDSDGDGMDDVMEQNYGTSSATTDSDADTIGDMEELLRGTNPLVWDDVSTLPLAIPNLRIHAYTSGADTTLQVSTLRQAGLTHIQLFWATLNNFQRVRMSSLAHLPNSHNFYSVASPGMQLETYRLQIPTAALLNQQSMAVAVKGLVDGQGYVDQIQFSVHEGILMEFRRDATPTPQGGGGGLFPTDPGGQIPEEARSGEVCVQSLTQVGSIGGGQVLYQVSDSFCGALPTGICFSSCSAAVGDSVVGIDVIGLLAN